MSLLHVPNPGPTGQQLPCQPPSPATALPNPKHTKLKDRQRQGTQRGEMATGPQDKMSVDRREAELSPLGPGGRATMRKQHRGKGEQTGGRRGPSPLGLRREDTGEGASAQGEALLLQL